MKLVAPPNSSELASIASGDSMQLTIDEELPVECRKLRSEVLAMLQRAAASLPDNCRLHVFEAFRSQKRQFLFWNERLIELAREFPEKVYDAHALIVRCMDDIASPVDRPSGHQGGSAVDVTIFEGGEPLDMGGTFKNFKDERVATRTGGLTPLQIVNRQRLLDCMEQAGFINYKKEWWHFSHYDRLWAAMKYFGDDDASDRVPRHFYKYGACSTAERDDKYMDYPDFSESAVLAVA